MREHEFPDGWDEERVRRLLAHYDAQTEEQAIAEDEAAWGDAAHATMRIPIDLVPAVRKMLAERNPR